MVDRRDHLLRASVVDAERARPASLRTSVAPFREPPDWERFLGRLTEPLIGLTAQHARAFREIWTNMRIALGPRLPVPQVEPGEDGAVKLCWSRTRYYAEIELHPDDGAGRCLHEWFFRDRDLDTYDGSTGPESGGPSLALLTRLKRALEP